jgi:hypothetical protein
MKAPEQERRDWFIIPLILGLGFLCVIMAGQWALHFAPSWELSANMDSKLDPNSDFLTRRPTGFIEPVDPSILTEPVWINLFLTPGELFSTRTPDPATEGTSPRTPVATQTQTPLKTSTPISFASATNTHLILASPTNTSAYYPPSSSSTPRPKPAATSTVASVYTPTPTALITGTQTFTLTPAQPLTGTPALSPTPTATQTPTWTSTPTPTPTSTQTPTNTPDPSEPDFGAPDGNGATLGNGGSVIFNLSGFALDGNSSWDLVYYEMEETSAAGKIHLGAVKIEIYDQTTSAWYTIYRWGDGIPDTNASYNNGNSEPDGFPVDKSLLYGAAPRNTGIALDIDTPAIGQGGSLGDAITQIRITSLSSTKCDVDAIQMLR